MEDIEMADWKWKGKFSLRGNYTLNQKLACFVLDLKIINTFLKSNICIL